MEWHVSVWTGLLAATAVVSLGLSVYVFRAHLDQRDPLALSFFGLCLAVSWWSAAYALQVSATTLSAKLFWLRFVWIGAGAMMVAWPAFVLVYTGRERWLRGGRLALLAAVPLVIVATVWSGHATTYVYLEPSIETRSGVPLLAFAPGTLLLFVLAYSLVVNLATYGLLIQQIRRRVGPVRRQSLLLLIAGAIPLVVGTVGNTGLVSPRFLDLTPIAFLVTTPIVAWAIFSHRLLELTPIARDAVIEDLSEGIVVLSADHDVVDANDVARSLFGEDILGRHLSTAFDRYPAVTSLVVENGGSNRSRLTVEPGERGSRIRLEVSTLGVTHRGREATVLLFKDVTDEEALQRRYQSMIEKSRNVVATVDDEWRVRYVSPSVEPVLGYDPSSVLGEPLLEYVHPDDRNDVRTACARVRRRSRADSHPSTASAVGSEPFEHRVKHANGTWSRFKTTVDPLYEGADEYVLTATDVTAERRYKQRLQVLNRVLRHDVKNNVNIIGGYADLLADHVDPEGQEYLETIDEKATALADLSELAREVDLVLHEDAQRQTVDMTQAVRRATERLQRSYSHAQVVVDGETEALARADPLHRSAIENVLENAIEHSDQSNPTVEVTVTETESTVDVTIADDGPGIPADEQAVLTSRRETPMAHASGLGLWLVNWIVVRSGGTIEFDENEPRGSVVRLKFPRAVDTRVSA
ncbi:histidine kinase N-terminal 7TM domain-containing protein [Natrialbaceae archaeon A-CW3]